MPKTDRIRIDYMPGNAACDALAMASEKYPNLRTPALIDKLIITGLSALNHKQWQPPSLWGKNREQWKLPKSLMQEEP